MGVKIIELILSVIVIHEITGRPLRKYNKYKYNMHNMNVQYYWIFKLYVKCIILSASYIKSCKRNDPNINDCLKKMVENLRPFISKGIPEMRILPLDPLTVPSATLNQGSGSMNFVALFTDLKGYGAKNFQIQRMK